MSVNWEDATSPAREYAYAAATKSGEFDPSVPTWDIYCDLREALIWALLVTGFPAGSQWAITDSNWKQVFKRLYVIERIPAIGCFRIYNNGDKPARSMFFTPEEVKSMIGLAVNAGNKTDAEFKKFVMKKMTEGAEQSIRDCLDDTLNPYYWERRHMKWALKQS